MESPEIPGRFRREREVGLIPENVHAPAFEDRLREPLELRFKRLR
jgi:hypothetical protein